jgi:hypothetical protein
MPVYVIQAGDDGPCKIGHATNVERRRWELQCSTHVRLRVVAVYVGGKRQERALHEQFKAVRLAGEWFKLSLPDDLNTIRLAPGPPPPPPVQAEEGAALPRDERCRLVRGLMKAKGLRLEDIRALGPDSVIYEGVRKNPHLYERLCEALGVDHQYLRCGRVYVRNPMGSA